MRKAAGLPPRNETLAIPTADPVKGRYYVLVLLWLAYAISIVDRYAMGILAEPIKRDLGLSDTMLGVLTGAVFGLFYATLAVPVARLADRGNRRNLISASIFLWSLCTIACGYAANAVQMGLARLFVGVGEAGSTPPAQSLIGDLFPEQERGRAVGIFASGANIGMILAFVLSGLISAAWGWRMAFVLLGLPGLLLAVVMMTTMREPVRGRYNEALQSGDITDKTVPRFTDVPRLILANRGLLHLMIGAMLAMTAVSVLMLWLPAYLIRAFSVNEGQVGPALGLLFGGLGALGTVAIGWLSDRVGQHGLHRRALLAASIPSLMWPCVVGVFLSPTFPIALALLALPSLLCTAPMAMGWALMLSMVPAQTRATVAAFALLFTNIGGLVVGPVLVGWLSDSMANDDPAGGLRSAMLLFSLTLVASAVHFVLSARQLRRENYCNHVARLSE
jgi:MFS family permease